MATKIEWTDETWNPLAGCSPVSEGCRNCYAARHALRLAGHPNPKISGPYEGTAEMRGTGATRRPVFTGTVHLRPEKLAEPLRWRKPRRVFVNAMSDLFHPDVPFEFVDRVFAVMAITPQHTYQVLSKRPDRMEEFSMERSAMLRLAPAREHPVQQEIESWIKQRPTREDAGLWGWPLPNVWLGTSVENQNAADERIPHLLGTPAAVRFLSCEPLLGPVDLERPTRTDLDAAFRAGYGASHAGGPIHTRRLHWIIVGGESGPGARACDVEWIRSVVQQAQAADVPVFVKQLGAWPRETRFDGDGGRSLRLSDRKGGDPDEWPADLRVREFPEVPGA